MKFKTFRILVATGVVAAAGFGLHLASRPAIQEIPAAVPRAQSAEQAQPAQRASGSRAGGTGSKIPARPGEPPAAHASNRPEGEPLRPMDLVILTRVREPFGDRVKEVFPGKPEKVSLYKDPDGKLRVKIDLDRDEKADEKWDIAGDEVKRRVSPADDEQYTSEFRMRGGVWVVKR